MNDELAALVDASPNFRFLATPSLLLAGDAAAAERYADSDPDGAMMKGRHFGETLAKMLVRQAGIGYQESGNQAGRVAALVGAGVIPGDLRQHFDALRRIGNVAAHGYSGDRQEAWTVVEACHRLGVWWYERQSGQRHGLSFQPPQTGRATPLRALLEKVEEQLTALHSAFDAGARPGPSIVIGPATADPRDWRGGSTVSCGQSSYLVHDPVDATVADDRSWTLMQAYAHGLDSRATPVRLRGLLIAAGDTGRAPAKEMLTGLAAQASFLAARRRGGPVVTSALPGGGELHTLVTTRPAGSTWAETFGRGDEPLDPLVLPRALEVLAAVAEELADLHRDGQGHRALDGESVLVPKTGRPGALRDPGLAWWPRLAGEGHRYRAPEQQAMARGHPGPATDVFQLAALLQHACAGFKPAAGAAIELRSFVPAFPERLDGLLRRALDPNPSNRPDVRALAAELRLGGRQLAMEASA